MANEKSIKKLIVIGDVHGQYDSFVRILRHAGLVDEQLNWAGGTNYMLQIGDIFDRGPQPRMVDDLLDKLQRQAGDAQGEVIRLIGNHELELLLSNYVISGFNKEEAKLVRDKLVRQVLSGELRAAYAYKGYLFTHAGVTRKLLRIFEMQLDEVNAVHLSMLMNMVFQF